MRILTASVLLFISVFANAQPWLKNTIVSEHQDNFYSIQKQFDNFWKDKKVSENESENVSDGGYQQFARWENFMKERAYPSGKISDPDILIKEYERTKMMRLGNHGNQIQTANWNFVGPHVVPASGGGAGRINCIAFHPTNNNKIYVGAACGGVWQTNDGGLTWSSTTDQLASISIADIAIDPINPDNIYVATGDGYGYEVGSFWGGTYTAGVMKSTDGGLTWTQSGLTYNQSQSEIIQRLIINPQSPNILLACTRNSIYRTSNSGATWTPVQSGHFYDMEFSTQNPSIVYACDNSYLFRSTNGGITFTQYSNLITSPGRTSIAVTPADTNVVFALTESGNFYRSTNGGLTFVSQASPIPGATFYGYYDCVLAASPVDPQRAIVAGMNMFLSDDGGASWNSIGNGGGPNSYVHVDNHALAFLPGSNITFFSGNDGGFFKTTDSGNGWTDLSNGLDIKQYYRMSSSEVNPDLMYAGAQDNGTDQLLNSAWTQIYGADGMDCIADYGDENTVYVSSQGGNFAVSIDEGQSFNTITPCNGDWTTPIAQDPIDPNTIYIGCIDIHKSTNKGSTWSIITSGNFTSNILHITLAPSNHNYIYACNTNEMFMTSNGGTSWTSIVSGLPTSTAALSGIAVSSANPLHVWVTCSGYAGGSKVFKSINGGSTWTNVSGTLPNIPVDCIVYQKNTSDELYIGTDFGVYYMNDTMTDWAAYQNGLPNVIVDDIEINYTASKLRVATYGRGIWESDLITSTLYLTDAGVRSISEPSGLTCSSSFIPSLVIKNFGLDTLYNFNLKYKVDNGTLQNQPWTGVLPPSQSVSITLGSLSAGNGQHTFTAFTDLPNGIADANTLNDQKISTFEIDTTVIAYPVTENFESNAFPLNDWRVLGSQTLLSFKPVGGFGNSSYSLMADFYYMASAKSYLVSKKIDLSTAISPVNLEFNVAYAEYSSAYKDTLKVSVSTDCGLTWTSVYSKTGPALATAATTAGAFTPASNEWRAEAVNLNAWIGFPDVMVRFEALSGYGNECYIDDINLHSGPVGISELSSFNLNVSPVPFDQELNINAGSENILSMQLTDITGKIILEALNGKSNYLRINTERLSSGVYFLKVFTSKGMYVKKVVKG